MTGAWHSESLMNTHEDGIVQPAEVYLRMHLTRLFLVPVPPLVHPEG